MQEQESVNRWKTSLLMLTVILTDSLVGICMKSSGGLLGKRCAQGKSIRDECNSGRDRLQLWQTHVKLVCPEDRDTRDLSEL